MSLLSAQSYPSHIGKHQIIQEGDDLLVLRLHGDITPEDARQLVALDREQARRNGYSLILLDCTNVASFSSATRQATFDEMKRHSGYLGSTGVYGASGTIAWLMKLVLRGIALLGSYLDDETRMFSTEAEARAFVAMRRPQRQLEAAARRKKAATG